MRDFEVVATREEATTLQNAERVIAPAGGRGRCEVGCVWSMRNVFHPLTATISTIKPVSYHWPWPRFSL